MIEKYVQAVLFKEFDGFASALDDNYLGLGPSYGDSIRKPAAISNWKENIANLY